MKKLYILSSIYGSVNFSFEIDSIITDARNNEVSVLICDGCFRKCAGNLCGNRLLCHECIKRTNAILNNIANIKILRQIDYVSEPIYHNHLNFKTIEELNSTRYKDIEIGYGVSSCYISLTRNLNPLINHKLNTIFNDWLEISMSHADIADRIITNNFDSVYVVNGRLFDSKPYQEIAFAKGIPIILGESTTSIDGKIVRMNFDNIRVHSVKGNCDAIRRFWDDSKVPIDERRKIAASFYENRIKAVKTNDKVYTAGQTTGLLPDDWDNSKTNIAIFNSSEDEFAAIGGEFMENNLFSSQLEGIKFLLENITDSSIHFYLRIHPNLMRVDYKYHTDLYSLPKSYRNITVIPGNSPVSSYSLMNSCNRIVTFGSTMGVESAYSGKSSIVLRRCGYYYLNVCFVPNDQKDVLDFVRGKISYTPNKEDALKYSYYYYNNERESVDNVECEIKHHSIGMLKYKFKFACMNLLCSELRMKFCAFLRCLGILESKIRIPKAEI